MWGPRAPLYTWVLSKFYPRKQCLLVSRPNSETVPECSENNSLSAGWSYRPQTHQAGLPEVQGAHPKTQRLSKFARVKKRGPSRFLLRLGWPYGPAGVGTAANGSRAVGHGPISRLPLQDFGLPAQNKQPSLLRSQKGNTGGARWRFGRPNTGGSAHLSIGWRTTHGGN